MSNKITVSEFYNNLIQEKNVDLSRKDNFVNWSLFSFIAILAVFFPLKGTENDILTTTIGILCISLAITMRFFSHSTISLSNIHSSNQVKKNIEEYSFLHQDDDLKMENLMEIVREKKISIKIKDIIWENMKGGFLLIFSLTILLFIREIVTNYETYNHWLILEIIVLIGYISYEIISLRIFLKAKVI